MVGFPYVKRGSSRSGRNSLVSPETAQSRRAAARDGAHGVREPGAEHIGPAGTRAPSELDAQVCAAFARRQGAERYQPTGRDLRGLAQVRAEGYTQNQILPAVDSAFEGRNQDAEPVHRFAYCLPIIRSMRPSAGSAISVVPFRVTAGERVSHVFVRPAQPPQPVPFGPPVEATQTATPAVASPLFGGTGVHEGALTPGALTPSRLASPHADPEWDAAMQRAYEAVRKAGVPVTDTLRRALQAKAIRVDDVARRQGSGGPSWVGEAMLVALGRKATISSRGHATSAVEALLAYADGILNNWIRSGCPRLRTAPRPPPVSRSPVESASHERPPQGVGTHLLHRQPKSEEEVLCGQVLADLRLSNTKAAFDRYLRGSRLHELQRLDGDDTRLVVVATSSLVADWLENRMKPAIRRAVEGRLRQGAEITFLPVLDKQS